MSRPSAASRAVVPALAALLVAALLALVPAPAGADPRWVFYTPDRTRYASPWYGGEHRIMIPFGCTRAPYYAPDSRCTRQRGFHHGIDIAMPCGVRLYSPHAGWVVSPRSLGPAYGRHPLRVRNHRLGYDVVIGHTRRVFVQPGDRVRPGMLLGRASDDGAPDGCHLHFEQRAVDGGLSTAVRPRRLLALTASS